MDKYLKYKHKYLKAVYGGKKNIKKFTPQTQNKLYNTKK